MGYFIDNNDRRLFLERLLSKPAPIALHGHLRECHFSGVTVAREPNMTRSGVSVAVKRGGEIVRRNPALRGKLVN